MIMFLCLSLYTIVFGRPDFNDTLDGLPIAYRPLVLEALEAGAQMIMGACAQLLWEAETSPPFPLPTGLSRRG